MESRAGDSGTREASACSRSVNEAADQCLDVGGQ